MIVGLFGILPMSSVSGSASSQIEALSIRVSVHTVDIVS